MKVCTVEQSQCQDFAIIRWWQDIITDLRKASIASETFSKCELIMIGLVWTTYVGILMTIHDLLKIIWKGTKIGHWMVICHDIRAAHREKNYDSRRVGTIWAPLEIESSKSCNSADKRECNTWCWPTISLHISVKTCSVLFHRICRSLRLSRREAAPWPRHSCLLYQRTPHSPANLYVHVPSQPHSSQSQNITSAS